MLKSLGNFRQETAQLLGVRNSNGDYDYDTSTAPTLSQVNTFINDSCRESVAAFDYMFLDTTRSYPFWHEIDGVQGGFFTGVQNGGVIVTSGSVVPFPEAVLTFSQRQDILPTFLTGVSFAGFDPTGTQYASTSTGGYLTYNNIYSGIGYTYQLQDDIDKIKTVMISNSVGGATSRGIMLYPLEYHQLEQMIPIGASVVSGTPCYYAESPGLDPTYNNKSIILFPFPTSNFIGQSFVVYYKKKLVDMVNDTDVQNVLPEQYQNIVLFGALEKIADMIDAPEKSQIYGTKKEDLINKLKGWDFNRLDGTRQWEDENYQHSSNPMYINSPLVFPPLG